jgi:hypothetical protein
MLPPVLKHEGQSIESILQESKTQGN